MNTHFSVLAQAGGTDSITYHYSVPHLKHLREHSLCHTDTSWWYRRHQHTMPLVRHCLNTYHFIMTHDGTDTFGCHHSIPLIWHLPEYLLHHDMCWWHSRFQPSPPYTPHQTVSAWTATAPSWHNLVAQTPFSTLYSLSDSICGKILWAILTHGSEITGHHRTIPHFSTPYPFQTSAWNPTAQSWHKCVTTVFTFSYIICITPTILSWHKHRLHICSISLGICHLLDRLYIYSISPVVCHLHNVHYTLSILTQTAHSITTIFPLKDAICMTPAISS